MDIRVEAPNLLRRYQEGDAFRRYVQRRTPLIVAALIILLTISLATTAGMVVYFGDIHTLRVLACLVAAPFVLAGSLFVQGFVFFSWLEQRAIDRVAGRKPRPWREQIPPIPWLLALLAVSIGLPFFVVSTTGPLIQKWFAGAHSARDPYFLYAASNTGSMLVLALLSPKLAALLLLMAILTPVAYAFLDQPV